ncbi:MAG: hypothetical protein IIY90_07145 [Oscillospiraceae bacterium]|nr:hypothetical protein [Oscillospiraceae bacterium]
MMMYYNNKRLALTVFWIVLGAVLVVLTVTEVLDSSIYSGMGGALMAVGTLQLIRAVKYRKDSEYKEKVDTELGDERNRFLRMKSWSWAGYFTILIEGIGAIIAMALGERTVQLVLSYSVCLVLVIYWIAYVILSKKY